jgi:Arc/MetJ-type ribon-helix-helix transcriptional regulator
MTGSTSNTVYNKNLATGMTGATNSLVTDDINNSETIKKSLSFPGDLWDFVKDQAGLYGEKSKVVQQALREMRERMIKSGDYVVAETSKSLPVTPARPVSYKKKTKAASPPPPKNLYAFPKAEKRHKKN